MVETSGTDKPYPHIPHYPEYSEVRAFLQLVNGATRKLVLSLRNKVDERRGTPQATQDWSDPDTWIPTLLSGDERKLAEHLWHGSSRQINPRYLLGTWLLTTSKTYQLLKADHKDILHITETGQDFLQQEYGATTQYIDYHEGLLHLLEIVSEKGPGKRADFLPDFATFLSQYSAVRSSNTVQTSWYGRMQNMVSRGLIERSGSVYQISVQGLEYLERVQDTLQSSTVITRTESMRDIRRLLREHEETVREQVRNALGVINPYQFEELVKQLLEAMGYENVEVTSKSNDGGVDVKAKIEVGITTVAEVVQAKRHQGSVGRPVLDQLRGSLHRFDAMRGTIITTGRFSNGTKEAAFEKGAAPITLIDGEKLIDLLIEHEIGVKKEQIRLLKFEPTDFTVQNETEDL
ncbi:MAG: restriction endonuclease [Chloroflexota bacterium]|nr:restriction endonuclease [Chloroflexota bacterium]